MRQNTEKRRRITAATKKLTSSCPPVKDEDVTQRYLAAGTKEISRAQPAMPVANDSAV